MADMTYKFLYYELYGAIEEDATSVGYADADQISPDYKKSVNILSNNGLLASRGGNQFVPQGTLTRAEAAAMASRLIEVIDAFEAENPGDNPSEKPEQPVDPDNPAEEPEQPIKPETPAEDPSEPAEDPSSWDLDGAPSWFLVGQPDSISDDMWKELITYYAGKERPVGYPSSIPTSVQDSEERAKSYFKIYIERLYNDMSKAQAATALDEGTASLSSDEKNMVKLVNDLRSNEGATQLKISPALCRAAEIRAEEVVKKIDSLSLDEFKTHSSSYFHSRLDGSSAKTVLTEESVGLSKYVMPTSYLGWGENLTTGYDVSSISSQQSFSGLKNSSSHRKNMVNTRFTHIGVAFYSNGTHSVWVQIFSNVN